MTREKINARGEGMIFSDVKEVQRVYDQGMIDLHAKVTVRRANWWLSYCYVTTNIQTWIRSISFKKRSGLLSATSDFNTTD